MTEYLDGHSLSFMVVCASIVLVAFLYRPRHQKCFVDTADSVFDGTNHLMQDMPDVILEGIGSGRVSMTIEWDVIISNDTVMVAKPKIIFQSAVPSSNPVPMPSLTGEPILCC